jgi:hypothetical protein
MGGRVRLGVRETRKGEREKKGKKNREHNCVMGLTITLYPG